MLGVAHNTFGFRVDIEKSFHSVTIDNVFRDNFVSIFGGNPYVKGIVGNDFDYRSFFTKAETSGGDNFHLMDNIVLFQCLLEMFGNEMAGRSSAAGSSTNKDLQVVGAYGKATTLLGNLLLLCSRKRSAFSALCMMACKSWVDRIFMIFIFLAEIGLLLLYFFQFSFILLFYSFFLFQFLLGFGCDWKGL